jgi:proteasome lid subunit RPN8/RPN11
MRIELAADIEPRLRNALRSAGRREIGGMLFAEQLAPSRFRVVDFSVDFSFGSHTNFRRDPRAHGAALNAFFERTGKDFARFNYLGEWHSHPSFSVRPSSEDVATMTELVSDDRNDISFAVLLIVRLRLCFWLDHSWTIFTRGRPPQAPKTRRKGHS